MMNESNSDDIPLPRPRKRRKPNSKRAIAAKKLEALQKKEEKLKAQKRKIQELEIAQKVARGEIGIVEAEILESQIDNPVEVVVKEKTKIWEPQEGVQTDFLKATEDEVLFSGGRGSGKSACLIVDPLRYCGNKNFRALVIRRTMPELRELIGRAKDIYPQAFPGCRWKEQEKMFVFPSGARIEFGYCDTVDDLERYRGQEYSWLGVDELTQFPSEDILNKLAASLRSTDKTLPIYKRATTNPSGSGKAWVKKRFIELGAPGVRHNVEVDTPVGKMVITRKWLHSTLEDNKILMESNPFYMAQLAALPEAQRKEWLYGEWDGGEGMAFPDFNRKIHVIEPFPIPGSWFKFRACDWGYTSLAVCLWFAADFDNNIYVYREYATRLKTADVVARDILALEKNENIRYGVIDGSVGDQRGISGPTIDEQMRLEGCKWRYADKSGGSRKAGKMLVHRYLQINPLTNQPKIKIFDNCKHLISELGSLPIDENDSEDVDTDQPDHAYDALRYGLMSRPDIGNNYEDWAKHNPNQAPIIVDPVFGY